MRPAPLRMPPFRLPRPSQNLSPPRNPKSQYRPRATTTSPSLSTMLQAKGTGSPLRSRFKTWYARRLKHFLIKRTDSIGRASSTPSVMPVSNLDTRSPHPFKSRQSHLPCKTATSLVLQRPVAVKQLHSLSRFSKPSSTNPSPCLPSCSPRQESLRRRSHSRLRRSDP